MMTPDKYPNSPQPGSEQEAVEAVANARMIEHEPDLDSLLEDWKRQPTIGLDTEFVRERTFRAQPGLIQISDGKAVWLVDAVAIERSSALAELLDDQSVGKILHSVGEDLEVLDRLTGSLPRPLIDTQIAAAMLGHPLQTRYEHLVETIFGAHLPGGKARNNWRARPLAPELLEYAASDVIWLPRLAAELCEQLEKAGRLEWLEEDCRRILQRAESGDVSPPLSRVKGAGRLDDSVLAVLEPLAAWREERAAARDLPRRFVVSDEALMELATEAARGQTAKGLEALPNKLREHQGEALIALAEQAAGREFQRPGWLMQLSQEQRETLRRAQEAVKSLAAQLDLDPALIASKKELTRLICGERPDWFAGWRGEVLTAPLEAASVNIPDSPTGPGSSAG